MTDQLDNDTAKIVEEWKINETEMEKAIDILRGKGRQEARIMENPSGIFRCLG